MVGIDCGMMRIVFIAAATYDARARVNVVRTGEVEMEVACRGNVHCGDKKNQQGGEGARHGATVYHATRWVIKRVCNIRNGLIASSSAYQGRCESGHE